MHIANYIKGLCMMKEFPALVIFLLALSLGCGSSSQQARGSKALSMEKEYYASGRVKQEAPVENGRKEGEARQYYESGKLMGRVPYLGGLKEGMSRQYYESGKLKAEIPFRMGRETGEGKTYHESGSVESIVSYRDGLQSCLPFLPRGVQTRRRQAAADHAG